MRRRIALGALIVTAAAVVLIFYGWRWYTTPALPQIPLQGAGPRTIDMVETARQEVARQPRSGKSWGKLAMVLSANGYYEPALICFSNAARFDGENPCWPYLHGVQLLTNSPHPRDGIPHLQKALALARKAGERTAIAFTLALAHIDEGQFDEAIQPLEELKHANPDDPRLHFGLGLLAAGRDDRAAARAELGKVADNPLCRKKTSILLANLSANSASAENYRTIQEQLPPDLPWSDPFEGQMAAYKVNRFAHLQEYQDLNRQGRVGEAIDVLRRFVAASPDAEVCFELGFALFNVDRFKEAAEALRAALNFEPNNGLGQYYLGAALLREGERVLREGKSAEAMERFRQSAAAEDRTIALETNLGDAFDVRGEALKHLGRTDEAIRSFREARVIKPRNLRRLGFTRTSEPDSYNCIAFAIGDTEKWWQPPDAIDRKPTWFVRLFAKLFRRK